MKNGPNKTVSAYRNRKLILVDERVFSIRSLAEAWLKAQVGDVKKITQFRIGPRVIPQQYSFAARVYLRKG